MNKTEMYKGFMRCKVCGYSATPDLIKESRKHFDPHTYKCSRCGWYPEAMPTESDAIAAWNTRADKAAPTPAQPEKVDVEALKLDVLKVVDPDDEHRFNRKIWKAIDYLADNYEFVRKV